MVEFMRREMLGLAQDFRSWQARMRRKRRGLSDLAAGRQTPERLEVLALIRLSGLLSLLFVILYGIGQFIPEGFDWKCCFSTGQIPSLHVPWVSPLVRMLNPASIFALTVIGLTLRVRKYHGSIWILALALLSLPTLWVLFLGNLDGLVVLGLVLLPIGVPLVLIKPQIAAFALLANRRWIVAALMWTLLSVLLWGLWPLHLLDFGFGGADWKANWPQDITLFPWGILIMLPLLWFSRGDEDLLMAAGSWGTPHLFPYHFIALMPALARMGRFWALLSWILSFTPLLANWWGPMAWHLGNLFSITVWLGVYLNKRSVRKLTAELDEAHTLVESS